MEKPKLPELRTIKDSGGPVGVVIAIIFLLLAGISCPRIVKSQQPIPTIFVCYIVPKDVLPPMRGNCILAVDTGDSIIVQFEGAKP